MSTSSLPRAAIAVHLLLVAAGVAGVTWGTVEAGVGGGVAVGLVVCLAEALLVSLPWRVSATRGASLEPEDADATPYPPPAPAGTPWAASVPDAFRRPTAARPPRRASSPRWRADPVPTAAPTAAVWNTD